MENERTKALLDAIDVVCGECIDNCQDSMDNVCTRCPVRHLVVELYRPRSEEDA